MNWADYSATNLTSPSLGISIDRGEELVIETASFTRPGTTYRIYLTLCHDGEIQITCTCPARKPCKHIHTVTEILSNDNPWHILQRGTGLQHYIWHVPTMKANYAESGVQEPFLETVSRSFALELHQNAASSFITQIHETGLTHEFRSWLASAGITWDDITPDELETAETWFEQACRPGCDQVGCDEKALEFGLCAECEDTLFAESRIGRSR